VKCANFVLCLCKILKKICRKIQASFRNVLSVISLKQRTKIRDIFKTRTTIPYQRDNSACSMRNIAVQSADQYGAINVSFSCEQSQSRWRFTPLWNSLLLMCSSVFHGKERREFESFDRFQWHELANLSFATSRCWQGRYKSRTASPGELEWK